MENSNITILIIVQKKKFFHKNLCSILFNLFYLYEEVEIFVRSNRRKKVFHWHDSSFELFKGFNKSNLVEKYFQYFSLYLTVFFFFFAKRKNLYRKISKKLKFQALFFLKRNEKKKKGKTLLFLDDNNLAIRKNFIILSFWFALVNNFYLLRFIFFFYSYSIYLYCKQFFFISCFFSITIKISKIIKYKSNKNNFIFHNDMIIKKNLIKH